MLLLLVGNAECARRELEAWAMKDRVRATIVVETERGKEANNRAFFHRGNGCLKLVRAARDSVNHILIKGGAYFFDQRRIIVIEILILIFGELIVVLHVLGIHVANGSREILVLVVLRLRNVTDGRTILAVKVRVSFFRVISVGTAEHSFILIRSHTVFCAYEAGHRGILVVSKVFR
jgi:hypothetical protein